MLDTIDRVGRLFMTRGWMAGLLLVGLTVGLGTQGFLGTTRDDGGLLTFGDALYKAISLLAIQTGDRSTGGLWSLELARWLGMLFWASAVLTLVIRLFRESVHRLMVKTFAKNHVIIAGLGRDGALLVEALRARGRTVVVIESARDHPAADHCRRLGAILLFGEPDDSSTMLAANLRVADALLALFLDESDCVRVATAAYRILHAEGASARKPPVRCVLRLTEPGLLDVVRRHRIKTDPTDRIQLEILNAHEIAATTMVREATIHCPGGSMGKLMVLGLGRHQRLGEMVVLRAAKDRLISLHGRDAEKLRIDVFDGQAEEWFESFLDRYPFVDRICTIKAHPRWSGKVGERGLDRDYDAAIVCNPDEGQATAQAVMLRREVLTDGQPILVRVQHRRSGYGELIGDPASGWGENILAVGLDDSLSDPDMATQPEMELRAQTIHHEYRLRRRQDLLASSDLAERETIANLRANRPWHRLDEVDRAQNRELAEKFDEYLGLVLDRKRNRYRREFAPGRFGTIPSPSLFEWPEVELDALAEVEHSRWLHRKRLERWIFDEVRNEDARRTPFLREYAGLTDEQKRYNRDFVRRIPLILALADYTIVAEDQQAEAEPAPSNPVQFAG